MGWASEYDSAAALADAAVRKLHALDPTHELLKFWIRPDGPVDPVAEKAIQTEMKDRFWDKPEPWKDQPGAVVVTVVMTEYYLAIQEVLNSRAGKPAAPAA